jgi:hypothetical protein
MWHGDKLELSHAVTNFHARHGACVNPKPSEDFRTAERGLFTVLVPEDILQTNHGTSSW